MTSTPTREEAAKSLKIALVTKWQTVTSPEELLDLLINDVDSPHALYINDRQIEMAVERVRTGVEQRKKERADREKVNI